MASKTAQSAWFESKSNGRATSKRNVEETEIQQFSLSPYSSKTGSPQVLVGYEYGPTPTKQWQFGPVSPERTIDLSPESEELSPHPAHKRHCHNAWNSGKDSPDTEPRSDTKFQDSPEYKQERKHASSEASEQRDLPQKEQSEPERLPPKRRTTKRNRKKKRTQRHVPRPPSPLLMTPNVDKSKCSNRTEKDEGKTGNATTSTEAKLDFPRDHSSTQSTSEVMRPERPLKSGHPLVHCLVRRSAKGLTGKFNPTYTLYLQNEDWQVVRPIILAKKQLRSRTPYYAFFDLTRGSIGSKLTKKSGNYMGKLRSNFNGSECMLYGSEAVPSGHAAIQFCREHQDVISKMQGQADPRAMRALLPILRSDDPHARPPVLGSNGDTMMEILSREADFDDQRQLNAAIRQRRSEAKDAEESDSPTYLVLGNKLPVFTRGSYRLNFGGRVTRPSVKNFQLVKTKHIIDEDMDVDVTKLDDVLMQFGRIGDDDFHLDYRAPLTPFQAFGIALAQFNF